MEKNYRKFFYWSIAFLFSCNTLKSSETHAHQECGENELIINSNLYHSHIGTQKKTRTCYAHSLAQTCTSLTPERTKKRFRVSPLFIALNTAVKGSKSSFLYNVIAKKKKPHPFEKIHGGFYDEAFTIFKKSRPCSRIFVEEFIFKLTKTRNIKTALDRILKFMESYKEIKRDSENKIRELGFNSEQSLILLKYLNKKGFTKKKGSFKKSYLKTLYYFFLYQCKGKYSRRDNILRAYKVKRYDKSKYTKDELIDIINENINAEKKHPIALSYKIKNLLTPEKKNGNHNSIIYGKACKNHKIYYLIRNSWGGPSLKDMTEKRVFLYKKYSGDFWISAETLKKTWTKNYGAIYIIKKKNYS